MSSKRRRFSRQFKAKVGLEALKEGRTINELSSEFSVHPNQVSLWKKEIREKAVDLFGPAKNRLDPDLLNKETAPLYEQIGRLNVELDWLKKKFSGLSE